MERFIGSAVRFAPASCAGDHRLAALSVVAGRIAAGHAGRARVPGRLIREHCDWKAGTGSPVSAGTGAKGRPGRSDEARES